MSPASLFLLLGSACLHVVVHVALKRARDREAFVWWMLLWCAVIYSPILLLVPGDIPPLGWLMILVSSIFEALYFTAIARAYRSGDLSLAYPLARGTAPALLLLWSTTILREPIAIGGVAGVALIAVGLYVINLHRLGDWREPLRALRQTAPRWALLAGVGTSLYTAVDKVGVGLVTPLLYTYVTLLITTLWLTPATFRHVGWQGLKRELRSSPLAAAVAGFMTLAAYGIVLSTMRMGTPAAYAGAVRECSVVLAAAYGVLVLKESGGAMRIAGSVVVAGGVAAIGLFG